MKSKKLLAVAVLMLTTTAALAQQHIQQAFDHLRNSAGQKETWSKHSVEKDPETRKMVGMSDEYEFVVVNPSTKNLVADIRRAFEQDEKNAYSVSSGTYGNSETYVSLAVGDSDKGGVPVGLMNGSNWIYACFLDPNDTLHRYRYAYALEWVDDGESIKGRIAKTYATTLKYRQGKSTQLRSFTINGKSFSFGQNFSFDSDGDKPSETWLTEFDTYKSHFVKNPDGTSASSYATLIYKLCKNTKSLDDAEKNIIATEIEKLKKITKNELIKQLFAISIEQLKK